MSEKISDPDKIDEMLVKLRIEREKRVHPAKDTKIITAWNGLMISAFAKSAPVFEDNDFLIAAQNAADFILSNLVEDGKLYHSYSKNKRSGSGYLDDYVYFIEGLIDLYEADFNVKWLKNAEKFADSLISDFWYNDDSCFNYASDNHKNVLVKFRPSYDQALPSGNAVAAMALQKLSVLTGKEEYKQKAERILNRFQNDIKKSPRGFCFMLCAMDFYLHGATEIAIIGAKDKKEVFSVIYNTFLPNKIIAFSENGDDEFLPLLKNKKIIDGKTTVYLCKDYQCKAPVTSTEELKKLIRSH